MLDIKYSFTECRKWRKTAGNALTVRETTDGKDMKIIAQGKKKILI